jgi:hypothetical protein|tara:strand:- start:271 stop:558 length:288 start_codon:yes stop_codon:yes gene_type:complete
MPDNPKTIEGLNPGDHGYWEAFGRWMDQRNKEKERFDAFILALELSLSAPTKKMAAKASDVANAIANDLTADQIKGCKAIALSNWKKSKETNDQQ